MTTERARQLRKNPTDAERLLWNHIRRRQLGGYRFRRQHPIGPYIADFLCFERRLIVEIDGSQHYKQTDYDSRRTAWLESQSFTVIRFWDNQVLREIESVKEAIYQKLQSD